MTMNSKYGSQYDGQDELYSYSTRKSNAGNDLYGPGQVTGNDAAAESQYSFRKRYGFGSVARANHNGQSIHRPQSYVELGEPAPSMNTKPRPDWLDETATPAESAPVEKPAPRPTESDIDSRGNGQNENDQNNHDQNDNDRRTTENNTLRETPTDTYGGFGNNGHAAEVDTEESWEQEFPIEQPATPEENIDKPVNPMQLEWFVNEDAPDPWAEETETEPDMMSGTDSGTDSGTGADPQPGTENRIAENRIAENRNVGNPQAAQDGEQPHIVDSPRGQEPVHIQRQHSAHTPAHGPTEESADAPTAEKASVWQAEDAAPVSSLTRPSALELNLYADRRYRAALERMQFAQWAETLVLLRAVQRDYPHHPTVEALINEAELKAGVVEQWVGKVRGRRLTVAQETILRRAVPVLLLLVLFAGGVGFYRVFIEPSRQAAAITQTTLRAIEEARQMAFAGRFSQSMALYEQVLNRDPGNPLARQGLRETESLYALTTEYEIALQAARAGNPTRAAALLEGVLAKSPGFRDAESQLAILRTQLEAQRLYNAAEADFRLQRWTAAVQGYEAVLALDGDFGGDTVHQRLQESYLRAGQAIVSRWPTTDAGPALAQDYFRRAANARRSDATIQEELNRLDRFFRGEQALGQSDLREAVNIWRSLYDENPQYLGGYLAEQLYRAYLGLANRAMQQEDVMRARDLYQLAAELSVQDNSDALRALDRLRTQTLAPTAQPTATQPAATRFSATQFSAM